MSKYASKYPPGVGDADTLDGLHAAAFALAAHDHPTMAHVNGVPMDHQVAFWQGANTLAGEAGFEWDSSDLKVPGNIRSAAEVVAYDSGAAGPTIWDALPVDDVTLEYAGGVFKIKPDIAGNDGKFLKVNGAVIEWAAGVGGVTDHSDLNELDYASAMHTGFSPTIHNFVDTTNHPVAGLTTNHFLKALSATTYGFAAHGLGVANITGAAPLASPTFTGTVTTSLINVVGTTALVWGDNSVGTTALAVIGTKGAGGSFYVNTGSLAAGGGWPSGLGVDGTFDGSYTSIIKIRALGIKYAAYKSILTFSTTSGTTETERMRILNTGDIGIGTTSPVSYGNYTYLTLDGKSASAGGIFLTRTSDLGTQGSFYTTNIGAILRAETNHPLIFGTNATEKMRLLANGNLLVGQTTGAEKLCVTGNGLFTGDIVCYG